MYDTEVQIPYLYLYFNVYQTMLLLILQITSLIIKRQTIANMESDMDRWIQDRDRLSKQLEKCQMKYDNATVLQKVRIVWTSQILFILTTTPRGHSFLRGFKKVVKFVLDRKWKCLLSSTIKQQGKKKMSCFISRIGKCTVDHLWEALKIGSQKNGSSKD